jgi:RNA polymerase sigma-70 factor (ECF subfamily)
MTPSLHTRFVDLIERHRGIVLKVASLYCRDPDERRDLVQEITMQLWRAFPSYDEARVFSTWAYRIALNVAISFARRSGRRSRVVSSLEETGVEPADERSREPDERLDALYRCMADLDPLNRALLMLYLDERSYREIAEVLGMTETNVATRLSRLKQRMRSQVTAASH